jgi:hypothetical protein
VIPANKLHIESLGDGWCDKDEVLLHAAFQLLKDCVDKEALFSGHLDWAENGDVKATKAELLCLYEWWEARSKVDLDKPMNEIGYAEDTAMLIRLVMVRRALWT